MYTEFHVNFLFGAYKCVLDVSKLIAIHGVKADYALKIELYFIKTKFFRECVCVFVAVEMVFMK